MYDSVLSVIESLMPSVSRGAIGVLGATVGIASNNPNLITRQRYDLAQRTNFLQIDDGEFGPDLDEYILLIDNAELPAEAYVCDNQVLVTGNLSLLEKEAKDRRYTILGNEGLLFRTMLIALERRNIYSFHACSLYDEDGDRLLIVPSGAGGGKTCVILSGVTQGLRVFSTEMTHFKFVNGIPEFHMGSMLDNVRVGTLKHDFQDVSEKLDIEFPRVEDEWSTKMTVDLSEFRARRTKLTGPNVQVIVPRVERNWGNPVVTKIDSMREVKKILFESASEKIRTLFLLDETIAIESLDTRSLSQKRWKNVCKFTDVGNIKQAVNITASPRNCLEGQG